MVNHMEEVAKMFGLELGEIFKIADDTYGEYPEYYRFAGNVCIEVSDDGVKWKETDNGVILECLLLDEVRIIELSWKPTVYDEYYYPNPLDRDLWGCGIWVDNDNDNNRFSRGLVCKTKERAIKLTQKMLATVVKE